MLYIDRKLKLLLNQFDGCINVAIHIVSFFLIVHYVSCVVSDNVLLI